MPVEAAAAAEENFGVSHAEDAPFLTRGHGLRKRASLEGVIIQVEEPVRMIDGWLGCGGVFFS